MSSVAEVDGLVNSFYNSTDGAERRHAEATLAGSVGTSVGTLVQILKETQADLTQVYCCLALVPAVKAVKMSATENNSNTADINSLLPELVAVLTGMPQTHQHSRRLLMMAISKINKLVMEDSGTGVAVVAQLAMAAAHAGCDIEGAGAAASDTALRLLAALVFECHSYDSTKSASFMAFGPHRRASTAFRDHSLRIVFSYTLTLLSRVSAATAPFCTEAIVSLIKNCLTYDFMAIIIDETEDTYVTQYPAEWREVLCSDDTLNTLGAQHLALPLPHCLELLRAFIGLIGTRRSFFDTTEIKVHWLDFFMTQVLESQKCADDRLSSSEYCNALADAIQRFIPPHGYKDLLQCPKCQEYLTFVANFSVTMFGIPFGGGGSFSTTSTLMQFWARLINSKRLNLTQEEQNDSIDIEQFVPSMVGTFVKTRIANADYEVDEDAIDSMMAQAELLPPVVALMPLQCLTQMTQDGLAVGAETIGTCASTLMWICYITGALVRTWYPNVTKDNVEPAVGYLSFAVSIVVAYQNSPQRQAMDSMVEQSVVYLLSALQHVFSMVRSSSHLSEVLDGTFGDKIKLFQFIMTSVGGNMMSPSLEVKVIRQSIELIVEACKDLPATQLQQLNFNIPPVVELPLAVAESSFKLRTQVYMALYTVKLPDPFDRERFAAFMEPISAAMMQSPNMMSQPLFIAGWLRDLRGVARSTCNSTTAFGEFLDWVLERGSLFEALSKTADLAPVIIHSLFKFLLQLVTPSYPCSRVNVPSASHNPTGVFLFQFVAGNLQNVMQTLMASPAREQLAAGQSVEQVYPRFLKPLKVLMDIARRCVTGDFCPFGVMQLYGDTKFDEIVVGVVRLVQCVPQDLYREYVKLGAALGSVLRTLTEGQAFTPFVSMATADIMFVTQYCIKVVSDTEQKAPQLSNALNFLAFIASLYAPVRRLRAGEAALDAVASPSRASRGIKEQVAKLLVAETGVWDDIVIAAMNVVTMQERGLSPAAAAVFPIFECDPTMWGQYKQFLLTSYPPDKQDRVVELLNNLGSDVTSNEKFFSNIVTFRMAIKLL
jgi:hypothetical protein